MEKNSKNRHKQINEYKEKIMNSQNKNLPNKNAGLDECFEMKQFAEKIIQASGIPFHGDPFHGDQRVSILFIVFVCSNLYSGEQTDGKKILNDLLERTENPETFREKVSEWAADPSNPAVGNCQNFLALNKKEQKYNLDLCLLAVEHWCAR